MKATPSANTYCSGHVMSNGACLPKWHFRLPSHIPSVFDKFIFRPEQVPKSFQRLNK